MAEEEKSCETCNWNRFCKKQYKEGCELEQWTPIVFDMRKYNRVGSWETDDDNT